MLSLTSTGARNFRRRPPARAGDLTKGKPVIEYRSGDTGGGGHAFAIVGYNRDGFLVQNSWGGDWGGFRHGNKARAGVALWRYEDFDLNVWDLWVARTALPSTRPVSASRPLGMSSARTRQDCALA